MAKTFVAKIEAFAEESLQKAEAITKESIQDVFEVAQTPKAKGGRMPVDTGFLRNSLTMFLNSTSLTSGVDSYGFAIVGFKLGDTVLGAWTSDYAVHQNYGTTKFAGNMFMDDAASQWEAIVNRNAKKYK